MNLSGVGFEHIWSRVYMVHVPCCPLGRHTHFFMTGYLGNKEGCDARVEAIVPRRAGH